MTTRRTALRLTVDRESSAFVSTLEDATARDEPGREWPNRYASKLLQVGNIRWHVQVAGSGPVILLLHGTGSATHSFRDLLPLLARDHTVVAPDLPGHGFTRCDDAASFTLPGMARAVGLLLERLALRPESAVGHSAGAAVLVRMTLDGHIAPRVLIGINAALLPFGGALTGLFQPIARLIAAMPVLPSLIASQARKQGSVERLIAGTGSTLSPAGIEAYRRVFGKETHIAATLAMMANWDLHSLLQEFSKNPTTLVLIVGDADRTVPPSQVRRVQAICPSTRIEWLPGLGHLAHEQSPERVAELIRSAEALL
jgi:magnesium chelatase accessory protein